MQNLNKENNEKERRDKERIERDKERNLKDFKENIPAPGQYSISENTITPSYSFPKSKTTSKSRSNERDNDRFYDVEGSYKKTQEKHFQSTIGKSKRKEDNVESKLGPGYYNLYDPNGTQKGITISERFNEKEKESTPGPGAYKPQWDSVDIIYTNDIKFGTSQKMSDDKQNDYPGPGFYKIEGKLDKGNTLLIKIISIDDIDIFLKYK